MLKASIVIPAFNAAGWIEPAIESCQKQTYPNLEIVVVDDCSTDTTPLVLDYLAGKDKRIHVYRNERNIGRSASRNLGNAYASGDVLLVLDADDLAYPDRVKLSVEKLKKAEFVYGSMDAMDCLGNKQGTYHADVFTKERALSRGVNGIVHSSCAYRKEIAERFKYDTGEISSLGLDDWRFQLEALFAGVKFDFIPQVIGAYRELSTGISKTRDQKRVEVVKDRLLSQWKVAA